MSDLTTEQLNKTVTISVGKTVLEKTTVSSIDNRISDLTQQITNIQAEIDSLKAKKALAETEAVK